MQMGDPWAEERDKIVDRYRQGRSGNNVIEPWEDPTFSVYSATDYHGFIHDPVIPERLRISDEKIRKHDIERNGRWRKMVNKEQLNKLNDGGGRLPEKLIRRVYKGIPLQFRMVTWPVFIQLKKVKRSQQGVYKTMLDLAIRQSPDIRQIDLDVNRTFRDTIYFRERFGDRQQVLFNVLAAYSMYDSEVGYCQGMSQLAGLLLIYLSDEEDAFWALFQLMTHPKYTMHGFFIKEFPKLIRFFTHHELILHRLMPRLAAHFEEQDVHTSTYALKWFMQCFLDRVPTSLCLRLWDIYLMDGERILIAMAYTILKMHKRRLLRMDTGQILIFLQSELYQDFLFDDDTVINSLKEATEELRRAHLLFPQEAGPEEKPKQPFGFFPQQPTTKVVTSRQEQQADPGKVIRRSMRKINHTRVAGPEPSSVVVHEPVPANAGERLNDGHTRVEVSNGLPSNGVAPDNHQHRNHHQHSNSGRRHSIDDSPAGQQPVLEAQRRGRSAIYPSTQDDEAYVVVPKPKSASFAPDMKSSGVLRNDIVSERI